LVPHLFWETRDFSELTCSTLSCAQGRCRVPGATGKTIVLSFPPFRLDLDDERLWKNGDELSLRRKPFAILRHLVEHPQRLVTHEELVEAVWGHIAMSESLLRTHVSELRRVLGEGAVETVVGRGYRFTPEVKQVWLDASSRDDGASTTAQGDARVVIGRDAELGALHEAFEAAKHRRRSTIFVTGEAGTGKTTLVDAFLEQANRSGPVFVGYGACVEQYGSGQTYLPALDAVGALCRGRGAERVIDVLARHAPAWLVQIPGVVRPERLDDLQRRAAGATQARMVCELADAAEALSVDAPVIVVFDDMQWIDPSTAELIAFLSSRRDPAQLLIVGTFRPEEAPRGQPLTRVVSELVAHRRASQIALEGLGEGGVDAYLSKRFPGHTFPWELSRTLERSTAGNPLFLTTLVDDLASQGLIREREGHWALLTDVEDVAARRPDSIRRLIDTQIDRLGAVEQRIIEVAGVAGMTFTAGVVANALDADADSVDSACESLASERRLLQFVRTETWPDGTIQSRYAFRHALFQHAALARSTSATVRTWHRKIAERLETGYPGHEEEVAGELAVHFEYGRMPAKAARYHVVAGERATRRCGYKEAAAHHERAHALLDGTSESRDHELLELRVSLSQGWSVFQANGRVDVAIPLLQRAKELAGRLQDKASLGEALVRLGAIRMVQGDLHEAGEEARSLAPVFDHVSDAALRLLAKQVEATTVLLRGNFEEARRLLGDLGVFRATDEETALEAARAHLLAFSMGSFALWLTGEPDSALALSRRAQQIAERAYDPFEHEHAAMLAEGALLHAWRREPKMASELAKRALTLSEKGGFAKWQNRAELILHWAEAELSPTLPRDRVEELLSIPWEGGSVGRTMHAMLYVAMCVRLGRSERALEGIASTLATIERTDERWLEPEFHRLRGEVLRSLNEVAEAARPIVTAIETAKKQGSRSLELRATLSLYALAAGQRKKRARDDIARLLSVITEGHDTPDVVEARAVIELNT
jgi:predicted ATPase/DNA-binding winged helix-turn-helix (wHTH) protein